jgi:HSP20 family protein
MSSRRCPRPPHGRLVERSFGTFMRRFELPFEADIDRVEASFDKGVLKISVPRSAAAEKQVKKIAIKGS